MKNNERNKQTQLRPVIDFFKDKRTKKYSRITYQVVWNLTLLFILILILGFSFAGGVGAGYFAALVKEEPIRSKTDLKKDLYNYEETSEIYFANKVYLGKLTSDLEREEILLNQMSTHLTDAIIATEDEYFYEHEGVVPKAIMRAIFQEMTNASVQSGGSTLTQQLIKNQILTNEVSFERKAKEILLALRVEKFFEKEEILQTYLNISTFGRNSSGKNIAGVQAASEGLFGIEAKKLNLPQSAFIAGLPQSPFGYTPYTQKGELKTNLEPGLNRMKTVLKRMFDGGYITEAEYKDALAYDLVKDFIGPQPQPYDEYPWVTYEIEKRSVEILTTIFAKEAGYNEKDLEKDKDLKEQYTTIADRKLHQNGYKIYSTIDKKIYNKMKKVAKNYQYYGNTKKQRITDSETKESKAIDQPVETGAILIENKSGKILSFVGGRDYSREQLNHATAAKRPNGSTMKPLLVYAPAIELGKISPASISVNVPIKIGKWEPKNYGGSYSGLTTAREALKKSHNVPAAIFYMDIINQRPANYLKKMGFTSLVEGDYVNPSMSLGALSDGVTVEENVNAYSTFANNGDFVDAYMIDKIETKDGKVVYKHKTKPVDVFSPQTAYLTVDMMRDVITSGTAASLRNRLAFSSDWAGKTGTGQDYNDAWFVATNPNVTFGTWMGYDTPKPLEQTYKGLSYSKRNIYLWADLMNAAYQVNPKLVDPAERFEMPGGIVRRSVCAVSGLLASNSCSAAGMASTDLFNAKFVPNETDDSFITGRYVQVGTKQYTALPATPDEFTTNGYVLNSDFFNKIGGKYLVDPTILASMNSSWKNVVVPNTVLNDNGKVPAPPEVYQTGQSIAWKSHSEGDVVGYRVYNGGQKVASIRAGGKLSYSSGAGSYYVTAVDIAGNESPMSTQIMIQPGSTKKAPETTPAEPVVDSDEEDSQENAEEEESEPADEPEEVDDDTDE